MLRTEHRAPRVQDSVPTDRRICCALPVAEQHGSDLCPAPNRENHNPLAQSPHQATWQYTKTPKQLTKRPLLWGCGRANNSMAVSLRPGPAKPSVYAHKHTRPGCQQGCTATAANGQRDPPLAHNQQHTISLLTLHAPSKPDSCGAPTMVQQG